MAGEKAWGDSDTFPAESVGAEALLPALPPVKDLKPKAGSGIRQDIEMIRSVEKNKAPSAATTRWFPVDNLAGPSPLQEGVEDRSPPPPHTPDFLTSPRLAGMGLGANPHRHLTVPQKLPWHITGETSRCSAVPRLLGML